MNPTTKYTKTVTRHTLLWFKRWDFCEIEKKGFKSKGNLYIENDGKVFKN